VGHDESARRNQSLTSATPRRGAALGSGHLDAKFRDEIALDFRSCRL
jgi:hypothetical protein